MLNPTQSQLPLVRLNLLSPLLDHLRRRGVNTGPVLAAQSLTAADIGNTELFVTARKMYQLVEELAEVSGDPYFGVHAGEELDPFSWSPLRAAVRNSKTLAGVLIRFMEDAPQDESSASYTLRIDARRTTFREQRVTDGGVSPRHNDGFTASYLLKIVEQALGPRWDGGKVIVRVCDPGVIPQAYKGVRVARQDTLGASITFPAQWLLSPLTPSAGGGPGLKTTSATVPTTSFVRAFRQALEPHIHEFELDVARAAGICGISRRTLARRLKKHGTTAHRELEALRRSLAEAALRQPGYSISEVAAMVGYANPVVFSRAFKRWHGMTPSQYRIEQDAP